MIPYATLFNMLRYAEIKRYDGIWQDWLCMQIEKGGEIEPWMMCLAENPIEYDAFFDTRIEQERVSLYNEGGNCPLYLSAGFGWKMYKDNQLEADEILRALDQYDEDLSIYLYRFIHKDYADDEDCWHIKRVLESNLEEPMNFFEEKLWNLLPQDTRDLFVK